MELFPGCYRDNLADGPQVIGQEEPQSKSISLGLWFNSGSRDERPEISGVTHLIEHLLFRGTENRSAYQITSDVDRLGGYINGSTSHEFLLLSLRILPESLSEGVDILTDLALNPLFREEDFGLEKDVVLEEIRSSHDDHKSETIRLLESIVWGEESGLSLPVRGTEGSLSELTREDTVDRFREMRDTDGMILTAAGNLSFEEFRDTVESSLAGVSPSSAEAGAFRRRSSGNGNKTGLRHREDWRDVNQLHCAIGTEGLAKRDEDRFPLEMLNIVLGQGMSSRLFREIRKERGLAYHVTSSTQYYSDTGLFFVYGAMAPENLSQFFELVLAEFDRLRNQPVSSEELELAKKKVKGNLVLGLENNRALMGRLGVTALHEDDFLSVDQMVEKIEGVSSEEIQRVANRLLNREDLKYSLLGPEIEELPTF